LVEPGVGEPRRPAEEALSREVGVEELRGPDLTTGEEALRGPAVTVASAERDVVGSSSPRRSSSSSSNSTMTMVSGWGSEAEQGGEPGVDFPVQSTRGGEGGMDGTSTARGSRIRRQRRQAGRSCSGSVRRRRARRRHAV
jgi:hypothetical protein